MKKSVVADQVEEKFLRYPQVKKKAGNPSRSTLWRWERDGYFPKRVKVGPRGVGWLASEVNAWMKKCPRVKSKKTEEKQK